jgi:hypothetical protein
MFQLLFVLAQAASDTPPASIDVAKAPRADDIVVTARPGEHPARLGPVLPDRQEPLLPRARLDLGGGASMTSDVTTHAREGVAQFGVTLRVPF